MMIEWMIRLLNMSFAAGCTALIVLLLRLFLKKMPKGYSYALWFIVLFRFLCPVSIPSAYSLLPVHAEPVSQQIVYEKIPEVSTGMVWIDQVVNQFLENTQAVTATTASVNPIQISLFLFGVVWQMGVLACLFYYIAGYLRLRRRLSTAIKIKPNIYETGQIEGAFVVGLFHPNIYIPTGLEEENHRYILTHEAIHLKRRDNLVKLLGLFTVMIHWFNPLAWISFRLLCKDMEMACDEQVLKTLGQEEKKSYSLALLHAAEKQSGLLLPLAFGESHTKSRIKNVLNYRKPSFWVSAVVIVTLLIIGVGLVVSPDLRQGEQGLAAAVSVIGGADGPTSVFIAGNVEGESQMPDSAWLSATRIQASSPVETLENTITMDYGTEDMVVFHGDFGLFIFSKEEDLWALNLHISSDKPEEIQRVTGIFQELSGSVQKDSVHREDRFIGIPQQSGVEAPRVLDYAVSKMENGMIAVLGGSADEDNSGNLIDLFYGYYDPAEQVMNQVYLFYGGGELIINPKGELTIRSSIAQ